MPTKQFFGGDLWSILILLFIVWIFFGGVGFGY